MVKKAKEFKTDSPERNGFRISRFKNAGPSSSTLTMGRPPFKPNLVTNVVFLLSVFQSASIVITNHQGRPFYGAFIHRSWNNASHENIINSHTWIRGNLHERFNFGK